MEITAQVGGGGGSESKSGQRAHLASKSDAVGDNPAGHSVRLPNGDKYLSRHDIHGEWIRSTHLLTGHFCSGAKQQTNKSDFHSVRNLLNESNLMRKSFKSKMWLSRWKRRPVVKRVAVDHDKPEKGGRVALRWHCHAPRSFSSSQPKEDRDECKFNFSSSPPPPPLSLSTCYFLFSCSAWQPLTSCHLASLPRPLILILIRRHQVRHLTAAQFVRSDLFIRSAKVAAIDAHQTADGQICCSIFRWKSVLAQIFLENLLTRLLST